MIRACCARHPPHTTKNHKHAYYSIPRLLCARQSFVLTQTRQHHHHHHHHHQTHHSSTIEAPQQQRQQQRRWWPNVAGDSVRARFRKKGKRENKTYQFKLKPLSKSRSHNGRPLFLTQLFLEPQNSKLPKQSPEIIVQTFSKIMVGLRLAFSTVTAAGDSWGRICQVARVGVSPKYTKCLQIIELRALQARSTSSWIKKDGRFFQYFRDLSPFF